MTTTETGTHLREVNVEVHNDLDAVRPEWDQLALRAGNVFGTWEWADAWHRHIGAGVPLRILLARRADGSAFALLPLYLARRRPVKLVRIIGAGPADELGVLCAEEDRDAAARALAGQLRRLTGRSGIFLGERIWGEHALAAALGGQLVLHNSSSVLPLSGRSFEDFLASRSRNFRSQVHRHERRLAREHRLAFRLTVDAGRLERDMQTLVSLHEARWTDGESASFTGARGPFHLDFARAALERGWLRLWTMELDGTPVAAWYGLRYSGIESYYQAGRDPALDRLHVGFVLLCHTIRCAFEDGLREYRFGLGDESYKTRFSEYDPGLDTFAIAAGPGGHLAALALRGVLRLPPGLRRTLRQGLKW